MRLRPTKTATLYMTEPTHGDDVEIVPLRPFKLDPKHRLVSLAAMNAPPSGHLHCHRDPALWFPVMSLLHLALKPAMDRVVASGVGAID